MYWRSVDCWSPGLGQDERGACSLVTGLTDVTVGCGRGDLSSTFRCVVTIIERVHVDFAECVFTFIGQGARMGVLAVHGLLVLPDQVRVGEERAPRP